MDYTSFVTDAVNFIGSLIPPGLMPYWVLVTSVVAAAATLSATLPASTDPTSWWAKVRAVLNAVGMNILNAKNGK